MITRPAGVAIVTTIGVLGLVGLGLVVVAQAGAVNVAATHRYMPGARWFFDTLSRQSIKRNAERAVREGRIDVPESLSDELVSRGAGEYQAMCVTCHGGPGVDPSEIGQGLEPEPPDLTQSAREMSTAQIFWTVEHGIRHTGMPAFGRTHSHDELWGIVAFVERLTDMSPDEYQHLTAASHEHEHG